MTPHTPPQIDPVDPELLLGLLDAFDEPTVAGLELDAEGVRLHHRPLPDDARAASAGLFCFDAPPQWDALGVAVTGRARHVHTGEVVGDGARAAVVVTRTGALASRFCVEGADEELSTEGGMDGLVVDALHRALGLDSPGEPVPAEQLVLAIWAHLVLGRLLQHGTIGWAQVLALHPGDPGPGPVGPSIEMLVEATKRASIGFDWANLRRRAALGSWPAADLDSDEAAWMDDTLFSRWMTSALPGTDQTSAVLDQHGCHDVADRMRRVAAAVAASVG